MDDIGMEDSVENSGGNADNKYSWTKQKIIELIEMLQGMPALWDISAKEYKNRNKKYEEMCKMAIHLETNVDEIRRKIKSLKTQFARERKKIEKRSRSGAGTIPDDNIWFGYEMMKFLMEKTTSLGSRSTLQGTEEESGEESIAVSSPEQFGEYETGQYTIEIEPPSSNFKRQLQNLLKLLKEKAENMMTK